MQRISHDKVQEIIDWHLHNKVPFDIRLTNQRVEFKSSINHVMNRESQFPPNELNFIQQVKNTIIKDGLHKKIKNRFKNQDSTKKIKYFLYNDKYKIGANMINCYEIDMKSAYWETAYRMGLLPETLYKKAMPMSWSECFEKKLITKQTLNKCSKLTHTEAYRRNYITESVYKQIKGISKASRLAAVGTLAKTVRVFRYDGEKQKQLATIRSTETEYLWHTICDQVGKIMQKVAKECGDDFLFYWVDAMFVRNKKTVTLVKKLFKQHGYDAEIVPCEKIEYSKDKIVVWGKGKWVETEGQRKFRKDRPFPYKEDAAATIEIQNSNR